MKRFNGQKIIRGWWAVALTMAVILGSAASSFAGDIILARLSGSGTVDFLRIDETNLNNVPDNASYSGAHPYVDMGAMPDGDVIYLRTNSVNANPVELLRLDANGAGLGTVPDNNSNIQGGRGLRVLPLANGEVGLWRENATGDKIIRRLDGSNLSSILQTSGFGTNPFLGSMLLASGDIIYARQNGTLEEFLLIDDTDVNSVLDSDAFGVGDYLGMIPLPDGDFVYMRQNGTLEEFFRVDGSNLANHPDSNAFGTGTYLGMAPLPNGDFVYMRQNGTSEELFRVDGSNFANLAIDSATFGAGTFLGLLALSNGDIIYARDNGGIELLRIDGTNLNNVFDLSTFGGTYLGMIELIVPQEVIPEPSSVVLLGVCGLLMLGHRRGRR